MPFQNQVGVRPVPAFAGDFASSNPYSTFDAGPGGVVAGAGGVTAGLFAWVTPPSDWSGGPMIAHNYGSGVPTGLIKREQQGLITTYLDEASMITPKGFAVTVYTGGDFWVKNDGAAAVTPGMKAYASQSTGKITFAATGTATSGTADGSIATNSVTFNGQIDGDILTVGGTVSGTVRVGAVLSGGTGVVAGTYIMDQITGTAGGAGTYHVSVPEQSVANALLTAAIGIMTITATAMTTIGVGDAVSGTGGGGVTASTVIVGLGTGAGGAGTYYVKPSQSVTATTVTVGTNTETNWRAVNHAGVGELVKIINMPSNFVG